MSIRSGSTWKNAAILLSTLVVGMLLGGSAVGAIVQQRLQVRDQFMNAEGFAQNVIAIIETDDPALVEQLMPKLLEHGEDLEASVSSAQSATLKAFIEAEKDAAPMLNEEQQARLAVRLDTIKQAIRQRQANGVNPAQ